MKKQLLNATATLSLFVMLTAVTASAQTTSQLTATIPFDFAVGKTTLPAGSYTLYRLSANSAGMLLLRSTDRSVQVVFNANAVQTAEAPERGRFEFRRYGDRYFLARALAAGSGVGQELVKSRRERELATESSRRLARHGAAPEIVTVTAQ